MKTRIALLCLAGLVAGLANGAVAADPIRAPVGDPRFGAVEAFRSPQRAAEAGVRWQRVLFWWSEIQPESPQDWNDAYFPEELLQRELEAGREVVGCLIKTPHWASTGGAPYDPPKNLYLPFDHPDNYWGQFVRKMVARYRSRINTWIIWNEPDVWDEKSFGYQWSGSVADYYQLLRVGYLAAKAANPQAKVLLAGLTYWWDAQYGRQQYIERLLEVAAADPTAPVNNWYHDAVVLQLYNFPRLLYDIPRYFREVYRRYGLEKPIWINETNVAPWDDATTPASHEHFRATMEEQASYIIQAFAYALSAGVERIAVYKMKDDAPFVPGTEVFGLVRADDSPRPAFYAYRVVARYLSGTRQATLQNDGDVVRVILEKKSERVTVVWNQSSQPTTVRVKAVASQALLVDRHGQEQIIMPQEGEYLLVLEGATYDTVPGDPSARPIGGPPLLLVENLGKTSPPAPTMDTGMPGTDSTNAVAWPETGHTVSGQWLAFLNSHGGTDNLGYPRSEVIYDPLVPGQIVQYFQRLVLEWHAENPPPHRIQRRLLGDILYPGADPPADPNSPPPGDYHYFPLSGDPARPTGLGHFVANYTPTGQPIYFKEYFDSHGGVAAFGYPKEEPKLRNGRWTQRFQAAVFEYHPENDVDGFVPGTNIPWRRYRVQLELLGDKYIAQNNLAFR